MDKIGWDAIENHREHELFMFQKRHKIVNHHIDEFGTHGGFLNAYKIYELPKNVNRNSIKVTPGYNMWSVNRYNRKKGDSNDGFSLVTGDFSDHVEICDKTQMFMDCENYDAFNIQSNVLYIMTQYVSLEQSMHLYDNFIKIMDTDCKAEYSQAEIRVFVNGYEVTAGDNSMLMLLASTVAFFIIALFIVMWYKSLKSAYTSQLKKEQGLHVNSFTEDFAEYLDTKLHFTMMLVPITSILVFNILPLCNSIILDIFVLIYHFSPLI